MSNDGGTADSGRSRWPEYLEPLRPDEMTRHRLRRSVLAAAGAMMERRTASWFEVTAGWSSVLAPLAAGLLVVFGTLAYRASALRDVDTVAIEPAPDPIELVPSLAPDAEAPPALLIGFAEPSSDALLAAALITP